MSTDHVQNDGGVAAVIIETDCRGGTGVTHPTSGMWVENSPQNVRSREGYL